MSAILSFVSPVAEEITQSSDQIKMRLSSQLINGTSNVLQKLLELNLNLIWLLVLYFPHELSFISTQFSVLNLVGWFGVFSNKLIIFCYYIILLLY